MWQLLTFYSQEKQISFKWKCNKNKCLNARNNCDKCQEVTTSLCANTVRYFVGDTVTVYILWMVNKPNWLIDCLHVCVCFIDNYFCLTSKTIVMETMILWWETILMDFKPVNSFWYCLMPKPPIGVDEGQTTQGWLMSLFEQ